MPKPVLNSKITIHRHVRGKKARVDALVLVRLSTYVRVRFHRETGWASLGQPSQTLGKSIEKRRERREHKQTIKIRADI